MTVLSRHVLALLLFSAAPLHAQWLDYRTPGIPRQPDGKPNLSAPAPRTSDGKPDLTGIWTMNAGPYTSNIVADLKPGDIPPWVDALYKQRREDLGKDSPVTGCLPEGPVLNLNPVAMLRIVQTPRLIAMLAEDLTYRQIFMDGRTLPKDPNPSFMGYSVGHWEGDTLVVETIGFNERTWLDFGGHPHSEGLRVTERIRRRDFGHLDIDETLEDSKIYGKPWTIAIHANLIADTEMLEFVCAENEKDRAHLIGKASDRPKSVKVSPEILTRYVGTYDFRFPENPTQPILVPVTMSAGELQITFLGMTSDLVPLSDTTFVTEGNPITFVVDDKGVVTHFVLQAAEGDLKVKRLPK